jgi:hypothetical protein
LKQSEAFWLNNNSGQQQWFRSSDIFTWLLVQWQDIWTSIWGYTLLHTPAKGDLMTNAIKS